MTFGRLAAAEGGRWQRVKARVSQSAGALCQAAAELSTTAQRPAALLLVD